MLQMIDGMFDSFDPTLALIVRIGVLTALVLAISVSMLHVRLPNVGHGPAFNTVNLRVLLIVLVVAAFAALIVRVTRGG
jgi:hypothetical protein